MSGPRRLVGKGKVWSSFLVSENMEMAEVPQFFFISVSSVHIILGGGFKIDLYSPLLGEVIQFDEYFSNGLKPPTSIYLIRSLGHWVGRS